MTRESIQEFTNTEAARYDEEHEARTEVNGSDHVTVTVKRTQERQELKELRERAREFEQKQLDSQRWSEASPPPSPGKE